MDRLQIHDLRCYGYTGYLPEENRLGQWFAVDLTLGLDLTIASQSDELSDTLDYSQVIAQTRHLIETTTFKTIERLAGAIATQILSLPPIQQVTVRLTKLHPPIPGFSGQVSVEITRTGLIGPV